MPKKKIIPANKLKSKLPRMPNKVQGVEGVPVKTYTEEQITAILGLSLIHI